MATSQTNIGCLVARVALGKEGKIFQNRMEYFLSKNGKEWTCNRMKVIWNAALLLRNDEKEKAISLYRENSIAYHKNSGIPKGPEGIPVARFIEAQRPSVLKRQAAVLRFYTSLQLSGNLPTPKQQQKAINAITMPSECDPNVAYATGLDDCLRSLRERKLKPIPLKDYPLTEDEIHCEHLRANSKYFGNADVPRDLRGEPYSSMAMSFMTAPWLPTTLDKVTPCFEMREHLRKDPWILENDLGYPGQVTCIQEQGCKARVVFQPSAWVQLAFMPLHKRLQSITNQLFPKESCVDSQVNGAYAMLDHLLKGKSVYCTDLSSATDRFPRSYSLAVLDSLGYEAYARALEQVCERPIRCVWAPNGEVKYAAGQPMGLYGSFPLFNLCNCIVADQAVNTAFKRTLKEGMNYMPQPFNDGTYFKVVGDDIIFSHKSVAEEYRTKMSDLGVPISEAKSFSGKVGEFAGFIGMKTNKSATVFRPYKVPSSGGITNPIQFLDALGVKVSKISPYWERIFKTYSYTITSRDIALDPIVPADDGRITDSCRGDNQRLLSLCNALLMQSKESLPDLSGSTKINSNPLFRERRMFDFYGYNRDYLRRADKEMIFPERRAKVGIRKDPLITEVREREAGISPAVPRLVRKLVPWDEDEDYQPHMTEQYQTEYAQGLPHGEEDIEQLPSVPVNDRCTSDHKVVTPSWSYPQWEEDKEETPSYELEF